MIIYKEKQYGIIGAGLGNIAGGVAHAAGGILGGAAHAAGATVAGAVPVTAGLGQVAAGGAALGSGLLAKGAALAAAHPLIAGGLAAYGLYRLLRRRRERRAQERGYSVIEKMREEGYFEKRFANTVVDPELGYKEREVVPKKIAKKASKKGVVQQDAQGRWRIINMNGPGGQPVYWKPIYKSRESAENCLRAYQSGKWNKK